MKNSYFHYNVDWKADHVCLRRSQGPRAHVLPLHMNSGIKKDGFLKSVRKVFGSVYFELGGFMKTLQKLKIQDFR